MFINGVRYLESEEAWKRQEMSYGYVVEDLSCKHLKCVKSSYRRGYIRRGRGYRNCIVVPYDGRYGIGYCVHIQCKDSTQYHIVEYWIKEV